VVSVIDEAADVRTGSPAVYTVADMVRSYRSGVPKPGIATRAVLIDRDGTTRAYDEFDVSLSTVHEHLGKAEAKLLTGPDRAHRLHGRLLDTPDGGIGSLVVRQQ
jgi:hypothetical protein